MPQNMIILHIFIFILSKDTKYDWHKFPYPHIKFSFYNSIGVKIIKGVTILDSEICKRSNQPNNGNFLKNHSISVVR